MLDQSDSVCLLYCMCVCMYVNVCKATQGSKRIIQLCTKDRMKTSEEPFQPARVIFTAIHDCSTIVLHWTYMNWQH